MGGGFIYTSPFLVASQQNQQEFPYPVLPPKKGTFSTAVSAQQYVRPHSKLEKRTDLGEKKCVTKNGDAFNPGIGLIPSAELQTAVAGQPWGHRWWWWWQGRGNP